MGHTPRALADDIMAEIVLSILLTAFKFELTDKPVVWNFSVVDYPTMGESSTKPELLLKVSPLLAPPAPDKDSPIPPTASSSDTPVTPYSFIDKGIAGSKKTMRVHHGAVDQTMVTTGSPSTVMRHVKAVLEGMGVEVIIEGDYKYRCTRPKRTHIGLADPETPDASTPPHQVSSSTKPEAGSDAVRVAAAVPGYNPGSVSPIGAAAIYGVAQQDGGDEVRFAVELTRLAQLDGTYSLDVRRLKGNLRSYTFLYDTLRQ